MIFLDFEGFESFPRPGYGYETAEMPDMTPEMTRFPWISLDLSRFCLLNPDMSLEMTRFPWISLDFLDFESILLAEPGYEP